MSDKSPFLSILFKNSVNIETRTITFNRSITKKTLTWFSRSMAILESDIISSGRGEEDIIIEFTTDGGDISAAFGIIDIIEQSVCKITIIATGTVASCGVFIFASGTTRIMSKYCELMWHHCSISSGGYIKLSDAKVELAQSDRSQKMIGEYMASKTKKPYTYWMGLGKHTDHFFTPDESLEIGLTDKII